MADSLPVLTFHTLECRERRSSAISFSPKVFQRGMARLHASGWRTLSLLEVVDCLRRGAPFPERSFVITFDDGYQSVYDEAFPILQRYGMSATVFLTVGEGGIAHSAGRLPAIEGRSMLSWLEIVEMQRAGIEFGAHTLTHPDLTRLPRERVEAEICESKAVIESALGVQVSSFAYPYGYYDRQSRQLVQRHFACACSVRMGLVTRDSDRYALERVDAYYFRSDPLFGIILTKLFPWYVMARRVQRRIRRAITFR
jgi:peptidoglycan/xylan/chitin deacetylase (PgdA/CDA1 family)